MTEQTTRRVARMADENGYHIFTVPGPWRDVAEVAEANKRSGGHWFDADTRRFFSSRWDGPMIAGRFFISSERCTWTDNVPGGRMAREYRVRVAFDDGMIGDLDGLRYSTKAAALGAARGAQLRTLVPTGPYSVDEVKALRLDLDRLTNLLRQAVEPEADVDRPAAEATATLHAAYVVLSQLIDAGNHGRGPLGGPVGRHLFDAATVAEEV